MIDIYTAITLILSASAGYGLYRLLVAFVPATFMKQPRTQAKSIIQEAQKQQKNIRSQSSQKESLELAREELKADLDSLKTTLREDEKLLDERENKLADEEQRLQKRHQRIEAYTTKVSLSKQQHNETMMSWQASQETLQEALQKKCHVEATTLKEHTKNHFVEEKTLEYQKALKFMETETQTLSKKKANLILTSIHARYSPDFVWPKVSHVVTEKREGHIEQLMKIHPHLVDELHELSGVTITPISTDSSSSIKFAGGFGIYREAAKLAFTEMLASNSHTSIKELYGKYTEKLNKEARELGAIAIQDLKLLDIHPEIQYLIGSLNWRTSYRQNQWLHTMEVAVLAGLLAAEIGEDPQAAKRCGLLHDIGKALDYRIEGSHAIISGDYADRFGEDKLICDTVMSHHADLVVESPLAYTLMAADTLSGARPGARVNIEEGYQLRLSAITEIVRSFRGVSDLAMMNGGREVHVKVNHRIVSEPKARELAHNIARKIEEDVSYPSQIKVQVSRIFESQAVA
ncbi:MAG: HDIG domain-containing protein [Proteobacteria bacterium]|nr:HDIG domain-containing protein [Pseudomonadota bacterium]